MGLKVEIISKEVIIPSTPTPLDRKTCKLSLLDQYMPAITFSVIHFYSAKDANVDNLKKTLSEVLSDYYPLAGRIRGNQFVDCNDEGINFIETQVVGHQLTNFLSHPEAEQLSKLVPVDNIDPEALLSIQANHFECGGMAIAITISHMVADASSLCLFVNQWAAVSRGDRKAVTPKFNTSSFFPPQEEAPPLIKSARPIQKVVSKRFVFDARSIAVLRSKISSDNRDMGVPTRVEAVSALMWESIINVVRARKGGAKPQALLSFPVNLRGRMVPPVPSFWFGNFAHETLTTANTENHPQMHCLLEQIRESIRKVDSDYVKHVQTYEGFSAHNGRLKEGYQRKGEFELCCITSWCRFPFYEADFGWGEPMWTTIGNFTSKNQIGLMDTKCGQGIEAWVKLDEEDMAKFQCQPELIAFTSTHSSMN